MEPNSSKAHYMCMLQLCNRLSSKHLMVLESGPSQRRRRNLSHTHPNVVECRVVKPQKEGFSFLMNRPVRLSNLEQALLSK